MCLGVSVRPVPLSVCTSGGTLGCCKSAHKVFIRLNLETLLLLASELVKPGGGKGGPAAGAGRGSAHQECHLVVGLVNCEAAASVLFTYRYN